MKTGMTKKAEGKLLNYVKYNLDIKEDKIEFQSEIYVIVITAVEDSKTEIKKRISPRGSIIREFTNISNFQVIMMLVFNIIDTNDSKPKKSNGHNSK